MPTAGVDISGQLAAVNTMAAIRPGDSPISFTSSQVTTGVTANIQTSVMPNRNGRRMWPITSAQSIWTMDTNIRTQTISVSQGCRWTVTPGKARPENTPTAIMVVAWRPRKARPETIRAARFIGSVLRWNGWHPGTCAEIDYGANPDVYNPIKKSQSPRSIHGRTG